jgi:hypothetical protein
MIKEVRRTESDLYRLAADVYDLKREDIDKIPT